jgi:biopolymer transport protein ExbD
MIKSTLGNSNRYSPLEQLQWLKNGETLTAESRFGAPILPLTSLIDAFCIIVIYLLIGTQSGSLDIPLSERLHLPQTEGATALVKEIPILRIENGSYFINDKLVRPTDLAVYLTELKKSLGSSTEEVELMIQADQTMSYADLDPVIKAGSAAGIQNLKFAVMPKR